MCAALTSVRNVGPAVERALKRAGISSAEELREMGADAAYSAMMAIGTRPHFIGYYSLVMGLQGRPWNDCQGAEKDALRDQFDDIVAKGLPRQSSALAQALNEVGIVIDASDY